MFAKARHMRNTVSPAERFWERFLSQTGGSRLVVRLALHKPSAESSFKVWDHLFLKLKTRTGVFNKTPYQICLMECGLIYSRMAPSLFQLQTHRTWFSFPQAVIYSF